MRQLIEALKLKLASYGYTDDFWNPGATSHQIEVLKHGSARVADDFVELYTCYNGTNELWSGRESKGSCLFPFLSWKPLPESLSAGFAFLSDSWCKNLYCVTEDGLTSRVLCEAEDAGPHVVSGIIPPCFPVYNSLEAMLLTVIECYDLGVYAVGSSGRVQRLSPEREREIALKFNPQVAYWEEGLNAYF